MTKHFCDICEKETEISYYGFKLIKTQDGEDAGIDEHAKKELCKECNNEFHKLISQFLIPDKYKSMYGDGKKEP